MQSGYWYIAWWGCSKKYAAKSMPVLNKEIQPENWTASMGITIYPWLQCQSFSGSVFVRASDWHSEDSGSNFCWFSMRQDHGKPTYIVKHFKLGVVEDEVHSGHFGKNGAIAQGVSHCSQPGTDLGKTCECKDKYIKIACYFTFSFGINFLTNSWFSLLPESFLQRTFLMFS